MELLQALASEAPDRVGPAAPQLEAIQDIAEKEDKRKAAARTLEQLPGDAM